MLSKIHNSVIKRVWAFSPASGLALSVCSHWSHPPLPKGEPLAKPYTSQFNRKLFRHAKASLMREVASPSGLDGRSAYPDHSFSRTSCGSSLKEGASGETGGRYGLPGTFAAMATALPLRKDFPRPGEDVAYATKGGIWHRIAMTERASQLPAAHSKSLIRLPKLCVF